jgi:hypothetical protein
MAPVIWYKTLTFLSCSQGMGQFYNNLKIACGAYLSAPKW